MRVEFLYGLIQAYLYKIILIKILLNYRSTLRHMGANESELVNLRNFFAGVLLRFFYCAESSTVAIHAPIAISAFRFHCPVPPLFR